MTERLAKAELTAVRVLEELRRIGFFTMGDLFTPKDHLKRISQLPPEVQAVVASVKVLRTNMISGDGKRE